MIWSYSRAFENTVSMKDAILNKAVLIQRKGISFTDMKRERKCWLRSRKASEAENRVACGLIPNANIKTKMVK